MIEELLVRDLGRLLVGVHSQHEHHLLLDPEAQTLLLDAFAAALPARELVAEAHAAWSAAQARLTELERIQARGKREEEYLHWQLKELRQAQLQPGEDERLASERTVVRHASRLSELVGATVTGLRGEETLAAATSSVRSAAALDPRLAGHAERLEALQTEVAD